jgi:hypothetical protein
VGAASLEVDGDPDEADGSLGHCFRGGLGAYLYRDARYHPSPVSPIRATQTIRLWGQETYPIGAVPTAGETAKAIYTRGVGPHSAASSIFIVPLRDLAHLPYVPRGYCDRTYVRLS